MKHAKTHSVLPQGWDGLKGHLPGLKPGISQQKKKDKKFRETYYSSMNNLGIRPVLTATFFRFLLHMPKRWYNCTYFHQQRLS